MYIFIDVKTEVNKSQVSHFCYKIHGSLFFFECTSSTVKTFKTLVQSESQTFKSHVFFGWRYGWSWKFDGATIQLWKMVPPFLYLMDHCISLFLLMHLTQSNNIWNFSCKLPITFSVTQQMLFSDVMVEVEPKW